MDRERIGLQARLCQLGRHRSARRLTEFEMTVRLLRRGVLLGWLRAWPQFTPSAGWIALLSASVVFYLLSLLLSTCERLVKNRWMGALRRDRRGTVSDSLIGFSPSDVLLAVRVAVFYRVRLLGRALLLFSLPALLTAAAVWFVLDSGVSRAILIGGAVCLLLFWLAALFFFWAAREPLLTAASLLTDRSSFAQRKSSLARLDKDCFRLARFSFSWLFLSSGVRFQAKAIFGEISRSAIPS